MADAKASAATSGSVTPNIDDITAMPTAPASIADRAFSGVMPPIAIAGRPVNSARRRNSLRPIGVPASFFELVAKTAIVGDAAQCRDRLADYLAAGVTHAILDSPQPAAELLAALRN